MYHSNLRKSFINIFNSNLFINTNHLKTPAVIRQITAGSVTLQRGRMSPMRRMRGVR
jgi:hypothetical protein